MVICNELDSNTLFLFPSLAFLTPSPPLCLFLSLFISIVWRWNFRRNGNIADWKTQIFTYVRSTTYIDTWNLWILIVFRVTVITLMVHTAQTNTHIHFMKALEIPMDKAVSLSHAAHTSFRIYAWKWQIYLRSRVFVTNRFFQCYHSHAALIKMFLLLPNEHGMEKKTVYACSHILFFSRILRLETQICNA